MKKFLIFVFLLIIAVVGGYFLSPEYLKTAIKYQTPDIDDYKIFENRTIKAGNHIPWEIASDYNKKEFNKVTNEKILAFDPVAFLIVQNNKIKFEKYWLGYDENSLSNSFSMAKSVVSLLIGIAIDEGKIKSVDQKVGDFIAEFAERSHYSKQESRFAIGTNRVRYLLGDVGQGKSALLQKIYCDLDKQYADIDPDFNILCVSVNLEKRYHYSEEPKPLNPDFQAQFDIVYK